MGTKPSTICEAYRRIIEGLTPSGDLAGGSRKFTRPKAGGDWDSLRRGRGSTDRIFTVEFRSDAKRVSFAGLTDEQVVDELLVTVAHQRGKDTQQTMDRAADDRAQIITQVSSPFNLPTDVWVCNLNRVQIREFAGSVRSEIYFDINYDRTKPTGV